MKLNYFLITIFLLFVNCGFTPLYLDKNNEKFLVNKITLLGQKDIDTQISDENFLDNQNNNIKVTINSSKSVTTISKDTKGNPLVFKMEINTNISINDNSITNKTFNASFTYNNNDNKFELANYEDSIERDLVKNIIKQISIYLNL